MTAFAKFVNKTEGDEFSAIIDQETGDWVVEYAPIDDLKAFSDSLNSLAPSDGSYAAEEVENWYGDLAMVIQPIGWYRALRLKRYYPDGEVVIYYDDEQENNDGQIVY